ncbi:YdeI/OmpD-associated family protein [Sphingomonas sp. NBWT7]|uniref:YdeI/OmpD-associated family protein n=1 Tax=Sphingomonas sp. NBWT7 TaxID=2596913 RepID=UPI0016273EE6|nr:YdeI/OmpD-associated family protein [Sphingomonas sp. NBWT7]QNE32245.1 YdeI/OmpD-associated family protein [Sphingomonas sp. NBWT7]
MTLALDTEPRTVAIPDDLALERGAAMNAWSRLSVTVRRERVDATLAAKRNETRARRIGTAVYQAARSPERS